MSPRLINSLRQPLPITSINVRRRCDNWFVMVETSAGRTGICPAIFRLPDILSLFERLIVPFFLGKDARDLERLIEDVYLFKANYKYESMPFWCGVAHLELAILDLLGKELGVSVGELLGGSKRRQIPVYLSSLRRDTSPDEELAYLQKRAGETGAKAGKLKIGGRMSGNLDAAPGWTEQIITRSRDRLGDSFALYLDANSSYTPERAIEIGRLMEEYRVELFEEPVPWHDFEGTKQVADALNIPLGAGEQEFGWYSFKWLIQHRAVAVIQPDVYYNGGLLRTLKVADLAAEHNLMIAPHSPRVGPTSAAMLHLVSLIANPWPFQEFHIDPPGQESWYHPRLTVKDGSIAVPGGAGLGFTYDPDYLDTSDSVAFYHL